jgi:type II secretory pathway component PulK
MTDDKVSEIIRRRLVKPYESVDEIKDIIDNDEQFETLKKYISVKSYIFRIKTVATVNSTEVTITAYYNRDKKSFLYWCEE